ncbi:MAG: beta-lactamase family protein, partial [Flavisolibacter sp.]|nr:beta-lactamase family protein [Flavisolibacter sp.]
MNKIISVLLFIFLLNSSFQQRNTTNKTTPATVIDKLARKRINATLKSFVDSGKVVGVSALIFEKNKEVYYNAFGYANREAKVPMDRKTIVRIYSMTKPITGVALMTLYEKGAFQLDDPLSKYAPEFANMKVYKGVDPSGNLIIESAKSTITISDLTRHTEGFLKSK